MTFAYVLAWLLPLLIGGGLVALAAGRPRDAAAWAATLGSGFVLGALLCATAVGLLGVAPVARIPQMLMPALLLPAAALCGWAFLRPSVHAAAAPGTSRRLHPLLWGLLALLAVRVWLMADELLLRPPYPWDAWAAWLFKPKAWMLGGRLDAFVAFEHWQADAGAHLRTADAWNYPEAVSRLAVWFASAWGEWNASAVAVGWLALWVALLAGVYGQLRLLGLERERALIAAYALGSLPLLNVHVALAGYADMWVAALLVFACLAWLRWRQTRRIGQLALAAAFAMLLPLVKLEGAIWLGLLAASAIYACMTPRLRRVALLLAPCIGIGAVLAYLLHWPLVSPLLDRMGLSADTANLIEHAPAVVAATLTGMFAQYNWHFFWFAVGLTLLLRRRALQSSDSLRTVGLFLLLGCAFLFVLFVLTPAGRWAESYTVVNRLGLQIVPAMLAFAALLWRGPVFDFADADARMAGAAPSGQ
jgi:hypothetical protein